MQDRREPDYRRKDRACEESNQNATYIVNSRGHLAKVEEYDPATMVLRTLTPDMKPTPEQIAELEEAGKHPIVYEDDCPELSPALIEAFKKAADERDKQLRVG